MTHICPYCGEAAVARIRPHLSVRLNLRGLYRHECKSGVYLHAIEWNKARAEVRMQADD